MAVRKGVTRSQFAVMKAFLLGVAFSLALLLLIFGGKAFLDLPSGLIGGGAVRFISAISGFWANISSLPDQILKARKMSQELSQLQSKIAQLQAEQWRLRELIEENRRLRKLLGLADTLSQPYITAEVIAIGGSNWFHTMVVNKGSNDGIKQGAPVICHKGLVGRVWEARTHYSIVLLITDRHNTVGVELTGHKGVYGIVKGTGRRWCELVHLSRHVIPKESEVLVTSGLGGVFPKGIPVGKVISVDTSTEPPITVVRPFFRLQELREVIILTNLPPPIIP
ncbi:MAG: rod shape-determining protein MreC [Candidatus Fervidibacter sp.]|uniref:rod shape-determining protein MreC n=1 Tax=Candidatus Fervidibacter sp. TaxID=3100871 RepID=UPI00404B766E